MSNEQTVMQVLRDADAYKLKPRHTLDVLGIDPDMSVSEHQRRMRIAERVLTCDPAHVPTLKDRRLYETELLLAWLIREDDQ
jgi:hypothetical protein